MDSIYLMIDMEKIYGVNDMKKKEITLQSGPQPILHRDMLIFKNIDLTRATDLMTMLFLVSTLLVHAFGLLPRWLVFMEALGWRMVFSGIIGYILWSEDRWQSWTRHYIKWGLTKTDAFNNWKA